MRILKWVALGLGALGVAVAAVAAFLVATFDPNDYKPRIVDLVKRQTGRTLAIDGTISVTFFPRIGAAVGKITLSEPDSAIVFARVEDAHVAVALWPLLSRQVIVDRVTLKELAVDLVRYRDGRTNFDDLAGRGAATSGPGAPPAPGRPGTPLVVDVGAVDVEGATIGWRDERDGTDVRLSGVSLRTGRLATGVPGKLALAAQILSTRPKASLRFALDAGYRIDFASQTVALSSVDAKVTGEAQGVTGIDARAKSVAVDLDPRTGRVGVTALDLTAKTADGLDARIAAPKLLIAPGLTESQAISVDLALAGPTRTVNARIAIASLAAKGARVELPRVDVDLTARQPDLSVLGTLATPVTLHLDRRQAELPRIAGTLRLAGTRIPAGTQALVSGSARADWGAESAAGDLTIKLDGSSIDAKVGVRHWSSPAVTFAVVADRLDADRYFPPSTPAPSRSGGAAVLGVAVAAGAAAAPTEQPWDLSPLKALDATGTVKIGALQVSRTKAEQVALTIKAARGRLDVDPISARLYQGTLAGSVAVDAGASGFAVKQRLAGVDVGPLLRDAAGRDLLEGRGAVVLDVTTAGTTVTALKKALAGTASIALKDGSIKGVDIVGIIGTAQTLLGSKRTLEQEARSGARTDFSEMTASFVIRDGVAHNDDLRVTSRLLSIAGRGEVDVGEGTLDYTAAAALTAAATGLGGRDLARLAGVAVPVRATGALASPTYRVDVGSLAGELAKGTLERELQRRLGRDKPDGTPRSDPVGDLLRGFLGKPKARPRRRAARRPRLQSGSGSRTAHAP